MLSHPFKRVFTARAALVLCGGGVFSIAPLLSSAQPVASSDNQVATPVVTVIGSRRQTVASTTDTAVPVDFIPMGKIVEQAGQFDLAQALSYVSPSVNSTRQSGADGADLIDSAALRGLGSDQTLVLVNGKRRHNTALVTIFGPRNRGNTGTDLNSLPMLGIKNTQILRDGAAAQYGSDAIAGVINFELKRSIGCESVLSTGQYSVGDGRNYLASAYCGVNVAGGVVGVTAEHADRGRSNRAEKNSLRKIGDSKVANNTLYLNGEFPFDRGRLYFTAGGQDRLASSAAFGRGPDQIPARNALAMYPHGFAPFINADINDEYGILGYKTKHGDWNLDFSVTQGANRMRYNVSNTLNASIANHDLITGGRGISTSVFDAGGFATRQTTANADGNRFFADVMEGINLAFGAEFRRETYKIVAGEEGSFNDVDGAGIGGDPGSQGFPGFRPTDETDQSRHSAAAYIDVETAFNQKFKLLTALRGEKYSDFGKSLIGKLASSYKVSEFSMLRGSISTGFRAPSLQQAFFSSTFTEFVNGKPVDSVFAPGGGPVATAIGIPKLREEKSRNFTFGTTWEPGRETSLTADFYRILIDNRIVFSGRFDTSNFAPITPLLKSLGVGAAQFFVNSIDTETNGLDITIAHRTKLGAGRLNTFASANFTKTSVSDVNAPAVLKGFEGVLLSEREKLYIEQGGPRRKIILGFNHLLGPWDSDFKIIHFGSQTLGTFSGAPVPNQYYRPKTSADLSLTYSFSDRTKLTVGGTNIFNVTPTTQNPDETDNGFKYESVQFGLSGASYFARLWHRF